jgi:hypothetical protein
MLRVYKIWWKQSLLRQDKIAIFTKKVLECGISFWKMYMTKLPSGKCGRVVLYEEKKGICLAIA